jgi:kynurenine formamidase
MEPDVDPTYSDLGRRPGFPAGTSWGLFDDPNRGTPSLITADVVREAAATVQEGAVFGLDYPVSAFDPGMSVARKAPVHTIYSNHPAHRDDYLDGFFLQGSSQIDALRHRRADDVGFYGNTPDGAVAVGTPDLGVQTWAENPIVSRGVLLDVARFREERGSPLDHAAGEALPLNLLMDTAQAQDVTLRDGDVLMIRTGWCEWFLGLADEDKREVSRNKRATGVEQSREILAWLWDHRISVLAADNFAVECLPPVPSSPFKDSAPNDEGMMHQELLAKLGLPLGELWRLDDLARHMATRRRWSALVVIKPLNVLGATGSPANATAIL